ncbi:MAG: cysteine synthase family protein [Actinomycetes bacterium]|jgi:cysteine synthase
MKTILDAIGDTPFLEIEGIWVKMEYLNPSGSIKARIAKYMIERAESEGILKKGDTIVEASSGNTGNAMSMVAAVKGYKMLVLTPKGLSQERTAISQAFGAEVRSLGDFHVNNALDEVRKIGAMPGYFAPQQFDNEWNVIENHDWLGQEILRELPAKPDLVVGGVGTGGTLIGVGKAFKEVNPECKSYALEPSESCTIACGEVAKHLIEGISDGFIPGIIERHAKEIDGFVHIHSHDAIAEMRRLARNHGIFIGPSSGAHMLAAKQLKEELGLKTVVTFFCDEGEKYINDYWLNPA